MTLMSVADFGKRHGVSTVSAYKWRARGWLVLEGTLVNAEASDANLVRYRDPSDPHAKVGGKGGRPRKNKPADEPPPPPNEPQRVEFQTASDPDELAEALQMGRATTEEARRVKENYLALKGKLDYEQAAGTMVEMARAEAVLFETARAIRNTWLGWPAKYAALIAAELNVEADRVTEVLTSYVHRQIKQLGEPDGDFANE